jgi:hypothetical protein
MASFKGFLSKSSTMKHDREARDRRLPIADAALAG